MNDFNEVVHKVDYEINVKHSIANNLLNFNIKYFSEVNTYYSNSKKNGYGYLLLTLVIVFK